MASSRVIQVPVFVDTSLGTHIAMAISPDVTVVEFKRELESMHSRCFPEIGNISANGLMVKRKSYFYHLPEVLPIKHAFQGLEGTWFIYMEVYPSTNSDKPAGLSKCLAEEAREGLLQNRGLANSLEPDDNCVTGTERNRTKWKRKKRMMKLGFHCLHTVMKKASSAAHLSKERKARTGKFKKNCFMGYKAKGIEKGHLDEKENKHRQESNPCSLVEPSSEILSETVSVSSIIRKYFSGHDEVTSTSEDKFAVAQTDGNCANIGIDTMPKYAPKTPPTMILVPLCNNTSSRACRENNRSGVGKRLVVASNNLGLSTSKRKPLVSLSGYREKKLSVLKSSSLVRNLVFEISDEEE